MKKEYTWDQLKKDLKKGVVSLRYVDGLEAFIEIKDNQGDKIIMVNPKSVYSGLADFWLKRLTTGKTRKIREEAIEPLEILLKYRERNGGGYGERRRTPPRSYAGIL